MRLHLFVRIQRAAFLRSSREREQESDREDWSCIAEVAVKRNEKDIGNSQKKDIKFIQNTHSFTPRLYLATTAHPPCYNSHVISESVAAGAAHGRHVVSELPHTFPATSPHFDY